MKKQIVIVISTLVLLQSSQCTVVAGTIFRWQTSGAFGLNIKSENALEHANNVVEQEPDYWASWYMRGRVLAHKKKYREALKDFEKAIVLDGSVGSPHIERADVFVAMGDLKTAVREIELGIKKNWKQGMGSDDVFDDGTYEFIGDVYRKVGRLDDAIEYYHRGISSDPSHTASVDFRLAEALMEKRKYREAIVSYTNALNGTVGLNYRHDYLLARAKAYRKIGDDKASKDDEFRANHPTADEIEKDREHKEFVERLYKLEDQLREEKQTPVKPNRTESPSS